MDLQKGVLYCKSLKYDVETIITSIYSFFYPNAYIFVLIVNR